MDYKTLDLEFITEHHSDSVGLLLNPPNPRRHRPSGFGNNWEETIIVMCGSCGFHYEQSGLEGVNLGSLLTDLNT